MMHWKLSSFKRSSAARAEETAVTRNLAAFNQAGHRRQLGYVVFIVQHAAYDVLLTRTDEPVEHRNQGLLRHMFTEVRHRDGCQSPFCCIEPGDHVDRDPGASPGRV